MVAFGIAPRINACGRMGKEAEALELFLTQDVNKAKEIAGRLNSYNMQRQEIEKEISKLPKRDKEIMIKRYGLYNTQEYTQKEVAEDYFLADLSLSEIAADRKISRSAVEDAIKKTCSKLDEFESKMHLLEKQEKLYKLIAKLKQNEKPTAKRGLFPFLK